MSFTPKEPESDLNIESLVRYIADLEKRIEEALTVNELESVSLKEFNVTPVKPRDGDLITADGVNFNPGDGKGIYYYDGTTYHKLYADQGLDTGDSPSFVNLTLTGGLLNFPGENNDGVKVGGAPAYGWHDILGTIVARGTGPTDPNWAQIGSGPFYAYDFAVNDQVWIGFHIPHDYAIGTDVYLHAHWLPDGTNANSVKWQFKYTHAKGHNQANFSATGTTVTAEEAPPGSAYRHMVTETAGVTISGVEPDSIIYVNITRITNGGTDNTDGIFLMLSDIHYQSTGITTPNKAPSFYA